MTIREQIKEAASKCATSAELMQFHSGAELALKMVEEKIEKFRVHILHGDDEHKKWLNENFKTFFDLEIPELPEEGK